MSSERRSLVEGIRPPSPEQKKAEEAFVYGNERAEPEKPQAAALITPQEQPALLPQMYNRVPITTRARPEVASALKRASLQRQLAGTEPFYVQEIVEIAIEQWLRAHGHLE